MPDGQVLIFGGFTFNSGGTGDRKNRSLELFDPAAWDLNPAGDPWTVLTQHAEAPYGDETTPTRGYTNLFLLPKPLPAANGGGLARTRRPDGAAWARCSCSTTSPDRPGPSG